MKTIVWFRGKDLRLADHAPLREGLDHGPTVLLFVVDPHFFAPERAQQSPHRIQFLLESLTTLSEAISERGSELVVLKGRAVELVPKVAKRWNADRVVAYRWVEPFARRRDEKVSAALDGKLELFDGTTLLPPGSVRNQAGEPYRVFTPFARAVRDQLFVGRPLPAPRTLPPLPDDFHWPRTKIPTCASLGIERNDRLQSGGALAAKKRLRAFARKGAANYGADRDLMDLDGTSRLSADLKFGTLSIREVWATIDKEPSSAGKTSFLNQLVWREFCHSTLWDRPELLDTPFRREFIGFPWRDDDAQWSAWVEGRTGYPVVDAASRQLLAEGFVHNRARMVAASFLAKHLMIDYRRGEAHYMQYLTDGDWAQNNAGWQWSAGCGCDAQPYFRVFNPMIQGKKFDPSGAYVRRWVPELSALPTRFIHRPWEAPAKVLKTAGLTLGGNYPHPIVEHRKARERFLETAARFLKGDSPLPKSPAQAKRKACA